MTSRAALLLLGLLLATPAAAVTQGQQDDFTSGLNGWAQGAQALGGPGGGSDGFLLLTSNGGVGQGSRLVSYNTIQWSGDYLAAGVDAIGLFVNNLGAADLHVRLAFGDNLAPLLGGTWYVTSASVALPAGSGWQLAVFDLGSADLQSVQGPDSYTQLMSDVATFRVLSAQTPSALGDPIPAVLGVDRLVALPEPGAGALLGAGLAALAACVRARTRRAR
jgi:hypothetical protein